MGQGAAGSPGDSQQAVKVTRGRAWHLRGGGPDAGRCRFPAVGTSRHPEAGGGGSGAGRKGEVLPRPGVTAQGGQRELPAVQGLSSRSLVGTAGTSPCLSPSFPDCSSTPHPRPGEFLQREREGFPRGEASGFSPWAHPALQSRGRGGLPRRGFPTPVFPCPGA